MIRLHARPSLPFPPSVSWTGDTPKKLRKRDNLLTGGEGVGVEPNHTTARKLEPLYINHLYLVSCVCLQLSTVYFGLRCGLALQLDGRASYLPPRYSGLAIQHSPNEKRVLKERNIPGPFVGIVSSPSSSCQPILSLCTYLTYIFFFLCSV
jgi:hypothetical protein